MTARGSAWALAVDFGTSSTAAAIGRDGGTELVGLDGGLPRMLSNVFWQESTGRLLLGDVADNASAVAPWCFERSPKLKLGQEFMLLGDHRIRVSEAVGAVLYRVTQDAIRVRGGQPPAEVRLTHPVRWGSAKRKALVEAATLAGLDDPHLMLEPVAAAMHYASEGLMLGQYVAVYDLGGGTLDVAVLQRTEDGFEVVGEPGGRDGFGGEEFDHRLYRFLGSQLSDEEWTRLRIEPTDDATNAWPKANRQFQRNVRRAKELLTHNPDVDVDVPSPVNRGLKVSVRDLNSLIRLDLEHSVGDLERTIRSASLEPNQLTAIYLAGGSSQIPLVGELIQQRLGVVPRHLNDCKSVICLGAALGRLSTKAGWRSTAAVIGPGTARTLLDDEDVTSIAQVTERERVDRMTRRGDPEPAHSTVRESVSRGTSAPKTEFDDLTVVEQRDLWTGRARHDGDNDAGNGAASAGGSNRRPPSGTTDRPRPGFSAGRRRLGMLLAGLTALILAAGVVALLASSSSRPTLSKASGAAPVVRTSSSGPVTVSYSPSWRTITRGAAGAFALGRMLTAGSVAAPIQLSQGPATLAGGLLKRSAAIAGAVPPQLRSSYGKPTTASDARVGGALAREYKWSSLGTPLIALVLPTTVADVAIICHGPAEAINACLVIARTAKVVGVKLLPPGPENALASSLNAQLRPAVRARAAIGRLNPPKLAQRAGKAAEVSKADAKAARGITRLTTPERYQETVKRLIGALKTESHSFDSLSKAASAGSRTQYARTVRSVNRASDALAAAAAALSADGIKVRPIRRLHLAGPPAAPKPPSSGQTSQSAPTHTYTAPTETGTTPAQTYTAPAQTYTAPAQTYTAPAQPPVHTTPPTPTTGTTPYS